MSAEFELASPPFDASDIAAAKQGLKSAIERIEAEALPAWLQQPERAECANDGSATADQLPYQRAYRFLDASEIAAAEQGLERAIEGIKAEAIPDRPRQAEAARENDCPATADPPAEIEGACPDGSEIAAAMQRLESAIERIKAEAIPACLSSQNTLYARTTVRLRQTCQPRSKGYFRRFTCLRLSPRSRGQKARSRGSRPNPSPTGYGSQNATSARTGRRQPIRMMIAQAPSKGCGHG